LQIQLKEHVGGGRERAGTYSKRGSAGAIERWVIKVWSGVVTTSSVGEFRDHKGKIAS
jgi:hypothetical protein